MFGVGRMVCQPGCFSAALENCRGKETKAWLFWVKRALMLLDHVSQTWRWQWPQANTGKRSHPRAGRPHTRAALQEVPSYLKAHFDSQASRAFGEGGRQPNQISTQRHNQGVGPSEQDGTALPPPLPRAQAGQLLYPRWQLGWREGTGRRWKGEEVGEGADLCSFSTPHPASLSKQSPHCSRLWLCPRTSSFWFNLKHSGETARNDSRLAAAVEAETAAAGTWLHRIHLDNKQGHACSSLGTGRRTLILCRSYVQQGDRTPQHIRHCLHNVSADRYSRFSSVSFFFNPETTHHPTHFR